MTFILYCLAVFLIPYFLIAFSGPLLVNVLTRLGFRQIIREEGPTWHKDSKQNTPTAGGIIFTLAFLLLPLAIIAANIIFQTITYDYKQIMIIIGTGLFAGGIGFLDDYLKKVKNHNEGLTAKQKLTLQILLALLIAWQLKYFSTNIFGYTVELSWPLYASLVFLVLAGSMNATNLTDGLDGLLCSVSGWSFLGLAALMVVFPPTNALVLFVTALIMSGICFGFWWINGKPARAFMGDTGSFLLGGMLAIIALMAHLEWYLLIIMLIPVIETLSVIIQVISAKLSRKFLNKDIRPFKMTPLHHHFEMSDWSEEKIVYLFSTIQALIVIAISLLMH